MPTANAQTQYVAPVPTFATFAHQAAQIVVRPKAQPLLRPAALLHTSVGVQPHSGTQGGTTAAAAVAVAPIAPPQERPAAAPMATTATVVVVNNVAINATAVAVAPLNTHAPSNPVALIAPKAERVLGNPARPAEPPAQVDDERPGPSAPREGQMQRQEPTAQQLVREVVS